MNLPKNFVFPVPTEDRGESEALINLERENQRFLVRARRCNERAVERKAIALVREVYGRSDLDVHTIRKIKSQGVNRNILFCDVDYMRHAKAEKAKVCRAAAKKEVVEFFRGEPLEELS